MTIVLPAASEPSFMDTWGVVVGFLLAATFELILRLRANRQEKEARTARWRLDALAEIQDLLPQLETKAAELAHLGGFISVTERDKQARHDQAAEAYTRLRARIVVLNYRTDDENMRLYVDQVLGVIANHQDRPNGKQPTTAEWSLMEETVQALSERLSNEIAALVEAAA